MSTPDLDRLADLAASTDSAPETWPAVSRLVARGIAADEAAFIAACEPTVVLELIDWARRGQTAAIAIVLADARRVIERDGWTTIVRRDADSQPWLDRAWTLAEACEHVWPCDGYTPNVVTAHLCAKLGTDALDAWNEAEGRTLADVLAALTPA